MATKRQAFTFEQLAELFDRLGKTDAQLVFYHGARGGRLNWSCSQCGGSGSDGGPWCIKHKPSCPWAKSGRSDPREQMLGRRKKTARK